MSRPDDKRGARRGRRRGGHGGGVGGEHRSQQRIVLTSEGFPAATPDAPATSTAVFVSEESLTRYPWLPPRVIAGSVWRGPGHVRVQVDGTGRAVPWRSGPGTARG